MIIMVDDKFDNKKIKDVIISNNLNNKKLIKIDINDLLKNNIEKLPIKIKRIAESIPSCYKTQIHKYLALLDLVLKGIKNNTELNYIIDFNWITLLNIIVENMNIDDLIIKNKPKEKNIFELYTYFRELVNIFESYIKIVGSDSDIYELTRDNIDIDIVSIHVNENINKKTQELIEELIKLDKYEFNVKESLTEYIINNNFLRNKIIKII